MKRRTLISKLQDELKDVELRLATAGYPESCKTITQDDSGTVIIKSGDSPCEPT